MLNSIAKATSFVHYVLKSRINEGDTVIDATMGNGNDTLFLAELVGPKGNIFSFDIQQLAIDRTGNRIANSKFNDYRIKLIKDSHENIENYGVGTLDAAMFNLGYLPRGDHSITTEPDSTIGGIKSVLKLLKSRGIMSIVIYHGHKEGVREKLRVLNFLEGLSSRDFVVMDCSYINQESNPPIIVFVEKR